MEPSQIARNGSVAFQLRGLPYRSAIGLMSIMTAFVVCGYRMGRHDMLALRQFAVSYERFDRTVTAFADAGMAANAADEALADFQDKASMRISSLTKNDGSMMEAARDISRLA